MAWLKIMAGGFPGGAVAGSLPANAGDTGSGPGPGRSHVPWGNWAREPRLLRPVRLEPVLQNERGHRSGRPAHHSEEWPPLTAARERPHAATKTQCSQK